MAAGGGGGCETAVSVANPKPPSKLQWAGGPATAAAAVAGESEPASAAAADPAAADSAAASQQLPAAAAASSGSGDPTLPAAVESSAGSLPPPSAVASALRRLRRAPQAAAAASVTGLVSISAVISRSGFCCLFIHTVCRICSETPLLRGPIFDIVSHFAVSLGSIALDIALASLLVPKVAAYSFINFATSWHRS